LCLPLPYQRRRCFLSIAWRQNNLLASLLYFLALTTTTSPQLLHHNYFTTNNFATSSTRFSLVNLNNQAKMSDAPQERSHTKNKESPETAKLRQADLLEVAPKLYSDLDSASPRSQSSEQPEQDDLYAQETSSSTFRGTGIPRATSSSPSGSTLPTSNDSHELDPAAGRVSSSPDLAGKSATAGSPVKANPKEISSVKEKILASGASKQELQRAVDNFTGDIEKRYGDTVNVAWKAWKIESKLWSFFCKIYPQCFGTHTMLTCLQSMSHT
jgi:hypothetical protein